MDWVTLISTIAGTLLTGGGLVTLVTLRDRKSGAVLENLSSMVESSRDSNAEWREIAAERERRAAELKADLDRKDAKIDRMYEEIAALRDRADRLGSEVAVLNVMRCVRLECTERRPPFGSGAVDEEEDVRRAVMGDGGRKRDKQDTPRT